MEIKDNVTNVGERKESNDSHRRVKRPSKGKAVGLLITFSVVGGFLLLFSLVGLLDTITYKSHYTKQEELTNVEGIIETIEVVGHEFGPDVTITLKESEKTFHIISLAYDACDKSIETDNLNGSFVYLSTSGNTIYSFKTDEKVYLTFDGYLNAHKKDLTWRYSLYSTCCLIGCGCMVGTILSAVHLKKIKKNKTQND